jgi:uncharacterized membrane protein YgdD (TMEM256/DUF423 family)
MSALQLAGALGATGVTIGAFGAHYLKQTLVARGTLESFKTGVQYQLIHAVAILALHGAASNKGKGTATSAAAAAAAAAASSAARWWAVGVLLFSGSIYGLSLGGPRILGPVTPLGGICMIVGWATLLMQ